VGGRQTIAAETVVPYPCPYPGSTQVLMDILGVAITCVTCHFVLVQLALGVGAAATSAGAVLGT
jgi:hypothetical protein